MDVGIGVKSANRDVRIRPLYHSVAKLDSRLPGVSKPQSDVHLHLQSADRTTVFFEALPGWGKEGEEGVYLI